MPVVIVAVAALVALLGVGGYMLFQQATKSPSFPMLADSPDPSLRGTVAYGNWDCIRVVSLSGASTKEVACGLGGEGEPYVEAVGWLPDGRLQAIGVIAGTGTKWSAIYDLGSGAVEQVPEADVPAKVETGLTDVTPDGRRVSATSEGGRLKVVVTSDAGTRVLLDVEAGTQYRAGPALWAPDFQTVIMHDEADRILLTTTGEVPATYVLVKPAGLLFSATTEEQLGGPAA